MNKNKLHLKEIKWKIFKINYRKQIDMVKKQIDVVQGWRYQWNIK
jgi:hypothetical protein